jgi:putative transposase
MFNTKTSLEKVLYLTTRNITRKWEKPVANWGKILGQLEAFFPEKMEKYLR